MFVSSKLTRKLPGTRLNMYGQVARLQKDCQDLKGQYFFFRKFISHFSLYLAVYFEKSCEQICVTVALCDYDQSNVSILLHLHLFLSFKP